MIRAALIALALLSPASAATMNDLTMTLIDGRPAFRPADGLDCYTAKFGGQVIDCALTDAAVVRPRRAPCWLRPDLRGPCPVSRQVMAALPAHVSVWQVPDRPVSAVYVSGGRGSHAPVPPVPLPGSGALLAAIVVMAVWGKRAQAERLPINW